MVRKSSFMIDETYDEKVAGLRKRYVQEAVLKKWKEVSLNKQSSKDWEIPEGLLIVKNKKVLILIYLF